MTRAEMVAYSGAVAFAAGGVALRSDGPNVVALAAIAYGLAIAGYLASKRRLDP